MREAGCRWVFETSNSMDKNAMVKVGAVATASMCTLFGGVVLAQYIFTRKNRAGKKTKIIEMVGSPVF